MAPAPRRPCPGCGARLARDNAGPRCSPCRRAALARTASRALRLPAAPEEVAAAFGEGGVPAVADALGCPLREALDLALLGGLVPASYRRRQGVLLDLLGLGAVPHVVAAEALGLSRWTVASYRRGLGVSAPPADSNPPLPLEEI